VERFAAALGKRVRSDILTLARADLKAGHGSFRAPLFSWLTMGQCLEAMAGYRSRVAAGQGS